MLLYMQLARSLRLSRFCTFPHWQAVHTDRITNLMGTGPPGLQFHKEGSSDLNLVFTLGGVAATVSATLAYPFILCVSGSGDLETVHEALSHWLNTEVPDA